jgi:hypothetical protein
MSRRRGEIRPYADPMRPAARTLVLALRKMHALLV